MSESESDELAEHFNKLVLQKKRSDSERLRASMMDPQQLQAIISAAVSAALQAQKADFEIKLKQATDQFRAVTLSVPDVVVYEPVKIVSGVGCDEGLDAVKSLPDFLGSEEE
ncbi:hypothetical protein KR026_003200, partial [Drosophila bipectinata]